MHSHDITALIRDTEAHERALFKFASPEQLHSIPNASKPRLSSLQTSQGPGLGRAPGKGLAVASLLGGDLGEQIRSETTRDGRDRGDVDVSLLLTGAEKLCNVYPIAGAPERITSLRSRHELLTASISRYEARVAKQTAQLTKMNGKKEGRNDYEEEDSEEQGPDEATPGFHITEEDLQKELIEIEELEKKKHLLEDRVSGMERDLGGLLR